MKVQMKLNEKSLDDLVQEERDRVNKWMAKELRMELANAVLPTDYVKTRKLSRLKVQKEAYETAVKMHRKEEGKNYFRIRIKAVNVVIEEIEQ